VSGSIANAKTDLLSVPTGLDAAALPSIKAGFGSDAMGALYVQALRTAHVPDTLTRDSSAYSFSCGPGRTGWTGGRGQATLAGHFARPFCFSICW